MNELTKRETALAYKSIKVCLEAEVMFGMQEGTGLDLAVLADKLKKMYEGMEQ